MDNKKRNIHSSGPLGMLVKSGQITKVDDFDEQNSAVSEQTSKGLYFKTPSGIEFSEQELIFVDPKECEPWEYANRQDDELGDIDQLVESIKNNKQLQPALIRKHPAPHDNIKYEIIFGRRRHLACSQLNIPLLAIRKDITNIQDAIATQDAENKFRNDVSNYSNAKLYEKLLLNGVFKNEKALSVKLGLSTSSLNDLMAYVKIPGDIVKKIPAIHELSKSMALKIVYLVNKDNKNHSKLVLVAPEIGKSITSPIKLEHAIEKIENSKNKAEKKVYKSANGKKLFSCTTNHKGSPCISFNKELRVAINMDELYKFLSVHIEKKLKESGAPD